MIDETQLWGAWKVVDATVDGEPEPDNIGGGFWFSESQVVIGDEDAAWDYSYRLDQSHSIPRVEIWNEDPDFPYRRKAVIDLSNEELLLCYSTQDQEHWPTAIESTRSSATAVLKLSRSTEPMPE